MTIGRKQPPSCRRPAPRLFEHPTPPPTASWSSRPPSEKSDGTGSVATASWSTIFLHGSKSYRIGLFPLFSRLFASGRESRDWVAVAFDPVGVKKFGGGWCGRPHWPVVVRLGFSRDWG